jgi:cytochrome c oxidase subunit II
MFFLAANAGLRKVQLRGLSCLAAITGLLMPALAVAADAPVQTPNIFAPVSTPAQLVFELSLLVLAITAAIFVVVAGLLVYSIVRFRRRYGDDGREPPQMYGSNQVELAWTVVPLLIVFVLFLATTRTIIAVQHAEPPPDALNVAVVGHQWWWEFRYPKLGIVTANELHVPVSDPVNRRPTVLTLLSDDVVHSFWVPRLAGKTDVVPNRENHMWIEPREPGLYVGQCAEYCGTQHAYMLLRVIVHPKDEFERWVAGQQKPPVVDPGVRAGRDLFFSTACINCHTVGDSVATGTFGPDLTHLMTRKTIGAGVRANTPENLRAWTKDPDHLKPGVHMPAMKLTDAEVDKIVAYLLTLK